MSQLVFNSFPRSGQVFLSHVAQQAYRMPMSTAHLPEIFGVKELSHISIFRNPADAIASLMNKLKENSSFPGIDGEDINISVAAAIETYDKYLSAVTNNLDNVHVVLFEDLESDYKKVIDSISNRFSLVAREGYEERVALDKTRSLWTNRYDGHLPRKKDELRLSIEEQVSSMESVHGLTERYHAFLGKI